MKLQELIVYSTISNDPIIIRYMKLLEATGRVEIRHAYFELTKSLIQAEQPFENYLYTKMIEASSPLLERMNHETYNMTTLDEACLKNDLAIIGGMVNSDLTEKIESVKDKQHILKHLIYEDISSKAIKAYKTYWDKSNSLELGGEIEDFSENLKKYGTGIFANERVFYIDRKEKLKAVRDFSPLPWHNIYEYKLQKEALLENTRALVDGRPYHHVILEGASGTGKSSSVKAVVNLFEDEKLRMIQIYKDQIRSLPTILEKLKGSIFKFIIFIDDLSFEAHDDDFKLLKSYIEGGIVNESNNVAFYVTSNRQHLIREAHLDRDDDVHVQDFIQETTSLSARFGLHLTFMKPNQKSYFAMIKNMLRDENMQIENAKLEIEARQWALRHNSMSGRVAMQFIKHWKMYEQIK